MAMQLVELMAPLGSPCRKSSRLPRRLYLIVEIDVLFASGNGEQTCAMRALRSSRQPNPAEALRILDRIPVDVLFSDIDMPGNIDGLALAQWVRQSQADTRIILTSGAAKAPGDVEEYASSFPSPTGRRMLSVSCEAFFLHPRES